MKPSSSFKPIPGELYKVKTEPLSVNGKGYYAYDSNMDLTDIRIKLKIGILLSVSESLKAFSMIVPPYGVLWFVFSYHKLESL